MKSVSRRRAADFVRPTLSEARLARMWSAISDAERGRLAGSEAQRRPARGRLVSMLAAAALIAALGLGLRLWRSPSPTMAGLVIDTGSATQEVTLTEGSTLSLAPATRLRVIASNVGEIRMRLERGTVICDVVHREERRFVVEAGSVEVEDRGTRFAVDVEPGHDRDAVAVRVERGAVEVHDTARAVLATLKPGQAWKSGSPEALPASSGRVETGAPSSSGDALARPPGAPSPPAPEPVAVPPPSAAAGPARGGALSRQALFERADAARLSGRHADAAADFERFYRRFPNDARAGLAAYELGRIRLGSLHDPRGAAEAFSVVLDRPDDPFREDAEAARVEALAALGDEGACTRARDAFRARYPRSPQAARVTRLCGAP